MRVDIGDVVLLPFANFDGSMTTGLFLVLYHEAHDGDRASTNFTGVKISSHEYHYSIPLEKMFLSFLHHDSFVNCNQQHRFQESQVIRRIGMVNRPSMFAIASQIKNYHYKVSKQLDSFIGEYRPKGHQS